MWQHHLNARQTQWSFSLSAQRNADFILLILPLTIHHKFHPHPEGCVEVTLPLPGRHNIANALAASAPLSAERRLKIFALAYRH